MKISFYFPKFPTQLYMIYAFQRVFGHKNTFVGQSCSIGTLNQTFELSRCVGTRRSCMSTAKWTGLPGSGATTRRGFSRPAQTWTSMCTLCRLATTHHSFLSSFSSVSKRNFASKYAFCSIFQNLQNYLAYFSKFCKFSQIFAKFWKISRFFPKIADFLQNFARFWKFS